MVTYTLLEGERQVYTLSVSMLATVSSCPTNSPTSTTVKIKESISHNTLLPCRQGSLSDRIGHVRSLDNFVGYEEDEITI